MNFEQFNYSLSSINKDLTDSRIKAFCNSAGWRHAMALIHKKGLDFSKLRTIEAGCGTGTFSLLLNILGAQTTLVDIDENALEAARKCFSLYNRKAEFITHDIMSMPPEHLAGKFDMVISIGLLEHFSGDNRLKAMLNHKLFLNENGFTCISVPNMISPFYWMIRAPSELFGKWSIETEIPFSQWELKRIGIKTGFSGIDIIGNLSFRKNIIVHSMALVSLFLHLFPYKIREALKNKFYYRKILKRLDPDYNPIDMDVKLFLESNLESVKHENVNFKTQIKDYFSAGIVFFGFQKRP